MLRFPIFLFAVLVALGACGSGPSEVEPTAEPASARQDQMGAETMNDSTRDSDGADGTGAETRIATFGAGCYWCVEAVLEQLDGVLDVESGFMGGHVPDPSYEAVCSGSTGHAEVVQVRFDPQRIGYDELLAWFWKLHDPTTLNRQGADVGSQYRSAIYYHSDEQRDAAIASKERAQSDFVDPIVTEISPASAFYVAKLSHQDYYRANKNAGYCRYVIAPKLDKLGLQK